MLTSILILALGFAVGFFAGLKNANSKKVAAVKEAAEKFKK